MSLSALHGPVPWPRGGHPLPDEEAGEKLLSSIVLDGIQTHHFRRPDDPDSAEELAAQIASLVVVAFDDTAVAELHDHLAGLRALSFADDLVRVLRARNLPKEGLRRIGRRLCELAHAREAVKAGIAILGVAADERDRDLLLLLGSLEEFTLFSVVALVNSQPDRHRAAYELARRVDGWGRIHAVERLEGTDDPEIKSWLLREGFRNDVMDEYLAGTAAITGDLYNALLEPEVDDELLDGAGDILAALAMGGPAEDLSDYPDALPALHRYVDLAESAVPTIGRLDSLLTIGRILRKPYKGLDGTESVARRIAALLERPVWAEIALAGLESAGEEFAFNRALSCATRLGLAVGPQIMRYLEGEPLNSYVWQAAMEGPSAEEAIELAERLMPPERLATGPDTCSGWGDDFALERAFEMVVWRLERFPDRGLPLVRAALANRVIRVRRAALKALGAWPSVPPEAVSWVRTAARIEPDDDLREEMEAF